MKKRWQGAFAALVTPFTQEGAIDEALLRKNLEMTVADGVHGLMVGGQYGEGMLMSERDRARLFAIAAEVVAGRVTVIAATGHQDTKVAIGLTRAAREAGVDGVMIDPPIYVQPKTHEVLAHFARITDAVDVPIKLCNTPARVGVDLTTEIVGELLKLANVVAIKHSGTDFQRILELVTAFGERLQVFIGPSRLFGFHGIQMGAAGFLDGLIQVIGSRPVELYDAAVKGDIARGLELQHEMYRIGEVVYAKDVTSPVLTKEAMRLRGRPGGWPRAPLAPMSEQRRARLIADLSALGLL
jgi:4-hydroxy-tetrahydrodipicolinate synthase